MYSRCISTLTRQHHLGTTLCQVLKESELRTDSSIYRPSRSFFECDFFSLSVSLLSDIKHRRPVFNLVQSSVNPEICRRMRMRVNDYMDVMDLITTRGFAREIIEGQCELRDGKPDWRISCSQQSGLFSRKVRMIVYHKGSNEAHVACAHVHVRLHLLLLSKTRFRTKYLNFNVGSSKVAQTLETATKVHHLIPSLCFCFCSVAVTSQKGCSLAEKNSPTVFSVLLQPGFANSSGFREA